MKTIKDLIKRNPVLTYFALTFAISWGGVYILGAPYGMPTTSGQFAKVWPVVAAAVAVANRGQLDIGEHDEGQVKGSDGK